MTTQFYHCPVCGNVITKLSDSGVVPHCCGQEMELMVPKTSEATYAEKHLPVVKKVGSCLINVKVGSTPHPMMPEHHIQFVYIEFRDCDGHIGGRFVRLTPDNSPECTICTCSINVEAVYGYCNVHGLWAVDCADVCGDNQKCSDADNSVKDSAGSCGCDNPQQAYYACD